MTITQRLSHSPLAPVKRVNQSFNVEETLKSHENLRRFENFQRLMSRHVTPVYRTFEAPLVRSPRVANEEDFDFYKTDRD